MTASLTPTITSTSTNTSTVTQTPTKTSTATLTSTPMATATPAPANGSAKYYYDGNGTMVKSVIDNIITYYPSSAYQVKTDGTHTNTRKYYSFSGTTVAMNENGTVTWLLNDQVNSTTITANADGSLASEVRYSAFGEVRYTSGTTITDKLYTGQQQETEIGLDYYASRFYDPTIAHFIQMDSIIPNSGDSKAFDLYSYVNNNPIRYNDPSGHRFTDLTTDPNEKNIIKQTYQTIAAAASVSSSIQLSVPYYQQPTLTSCGETQLATAWNYKHPEYSMEPSTVLQFASTTNQIQNPSQTIYVPHDPYTSPTAMQDLATIYAQQKNTLLPSYGNVSDEETAENILLFQLHIGNPIIIDASTWVGYPFRTKEVNDAHFLVITGYDSTTNSFTYDDSFGYNRDTGASVPGVYTKSFSEIWKSWSNNSDGKEGYGGNGWYMIVQ